MVVFGLIAAEVLDRKAADYRDTVVDTESKLVAAGLVQRRLESRSMASIHCPGFAIEVENAIGVEVALLWG